MTKGITDIDEGTIRRIDWQELLPVSLLVRVFSLSLSPFAICLLALFFAFYAFGVSIPNPLDFWIPSRDAQMMLWSFSPSTILSCFSRLRPPLDANFLVAVVYAVTGLFLWLVFARSLAVRIASTQRSSFFQSLTFAGQKFKSVLLALALPAIAIAFLGLILKLSFAMESLDGSFRQLNHALFPLFMIVACAKTFLVLLTICAIPLIISAVATDASDGFDAFSRAVSYLTQRPLHFICYAYISLWFCAIGCRILAYGISLVGNEYVLAICHSKPIDSSQWMYLWSCFFYFILLGFISYSVVCASTAIYFMLRRSVDGTPLDNFLSTDSHKPSRRLQPIIRDAQGAPVTPGPVFDSADESPSDGADQ
ncbi:MAG: hypothetical protein PHQ75_09855 [Thermoguttaceae bacterium]|nr:hypothetical protein [Thermoguttaceae bacterium]